MRADPENGYINDHQVYIGKENRLAKHGLATRVVMDMVSGIENHYHIVNCNNFFVSLILHQDLLMVDTYARGTVRNNRKDFPRTLLYKKCPKNQGDMMVA